MKKLIILPVIIAALLAIVAACNDSTTANKSGNITFYEVPLVCGAAPEIGCGSRLKPLFIDTEKEKAIKESWSNRQGTIIAIIWNEPANEELIQSLFKKHDIEAKPISENEKKEELTTSLEGKDKWYKGMDVDQLSLEEAGIIASTLTMFAKDAKLITEQEASTIKKELEEYFKKELVIVRTNKELRSEKTQGRWRADGYNIYVKNIGKERADKVAVLFDNDFSNTKECDTEGECAGDKKKDCCKKK